MKQVKTALLQLLIMSLLLGMVYPLVITGMARLAFPGRAGGSLVRVDGRVAGSWLIGQKFSRPRYFHGRPSANDYDGLHSGGSNLGPTNGKLINRAGELAERVRKENGLPAYAKVPADLVLSSGSGLDPHVSMEAALLQAPRVARERGMGLPAVVDLVKRSGEKRYFGIYGDSLVNVLRLNLSLDGMDTEQ